SASQRTGSRSDSGITTSNAWLPFEGPKARTTPRIFSRPRLSWKDICGFRNESLRNSVSLARLRSPTGGPSWPDPILPTMQPTTHRLETSSDARTDTRLTLRAVKLTKRYKKRAVVQDVSIHVSQGEIVGLLGPNGAGKTTTFYMIVGLVRPNAGSIFVGDRDITGLPMYKRARMGVGYLAQEASVFTKLTVEDNLHAVLEFQDMTREERKRRVESLIDDFGLQRVRGSKGYSLSGGERRRTEIARAMATDPAFILLDEPFAGVDPIAVEDIQSIVAGLKSRDIGVLITDHNVHETLAITDRAYLLYEGRILTQGTSEALAADEEVRRRYLGEKFTLERYR